ncbi:hypothetical protein BV25DRAFT_1816415, partial [Artomyces pyxidatus]
IVDKSNRIIAVLAGAPEGEDWSKCIAGATAAFKEAQSTLVFPRGLRRRGNFPTISVGVSFGGGQVEPQNLRQNKRNVETLNKLLENRFLRRLAGFGSSVFAHMAPKLFVHYYEYLDPLFQRSKNLLRPFSNSIFPAATFNFGPRVVTDMHYDHGNVPYGWCSITSLGDFNPDLGGHIYLWELKLVIRFPPGGTMNIMSSTVQHGNIPVQPGETRFSFTQFCSGGMFRWVDYGFRTAVRFLKEDPVGKAEQDSKRRLRWPRFIELFSKVEELKDDVASVFV